MSNKLTKLLLILLTLVVIVAMVGLVACTDDEGDDDSVDDVITPTTTTTMSFTQYMNKLNSGLSTSESALSSAVNYHVSSEYTLITREENLTLTYEAVYKQNRRRGAYYIRIFDYDNHKERLSCYYDTNDLYITVSTENDSKANHFIIEDFGTLLIFDTFSAFLDLLDVGELLYGDVMQEYFSETTILSSALGVRNLSYIKSGENGERITISDVDLSIIQGTLNARLTALGDNLGESFDAISEHYLGFRLSRLLGMTFGSIGVESLNFDLTGGAITSTDVEVGGRMQDNTPYSLDGKYAYDSVTTEITSAKKIPTQYVYSSVSPGKGSFEGKSTLPTMRDSDFDFALDYDVNAADNAINEFTMRIYDQRSASDEVTVDTRYDDINEIISAYYDEETLYVNTEGAYDYIGSTVALNALRLPKIYFSNFNLASLMSIAYTDLLQVIETFTMPDAGGSANKKLLESMQNAIASDMTKREISITVTEDLIKQIRGDDKELEAVIGEMFGVEEDTIIKYFGNNFFENVTIVLRYNFKTSVFAIDVYNVDELIMTTDMESIGYQGTTFPYDLNELSYTEFREPDVVTVTYDIELNPYGAESVDVSKFIGAFVGDATGKNTPFALTTGNVIAVRGRMSEYYVNNVKGERQAVTTMDLSIYSVNNGSGAETLMMTITTSMEDVGQMLVGIYTDVGDYTARDGIKYVIDREKISEQLATLTEGDNVFAGNTGLSAFLSIYNAAEKNAKSYTDDGYFCVDLTVSDVKDPVNELIGIQHTNARVKCKIGFDTLDLSAVDADEYKEPYIHSTDEVSATSIYSTGSKWKETATVQIGSKKINMLVSYDESTIAIKTGQKDYYPSADIFGKTFGYSLHIVSATGTYQVKNINITNDILVIDPSMTNIVPRSISVMFEGGESGYLNCEVEGFLDSLVTPDGYNLPLLAGVKTGMPTYKLVIGKDSIATIEKQIYVAVINRQVKPITTSDGEEMYYVSGVEQIPVVAEYDADPYTYAMTTRLYKNAGEEYDYLAEQLSLGRETLNFENLYGYETTIDENTGEEVKTPLYYDVEGYNWFFLTDLDLDWEMSDEAFSWLGETRYAVGVYGDESNGYATKVAIKVVVKSKIVSYVQIDSYQQGAYTIDYLKQESYTIPVATTTDHTVTVVFEDGSERIVSRSRPAILSDEDYASTYVYGDLVWEGTTNLADKLSLDGSIGLFGTGTSATNTTKATFGAELGLGTQEVTLTVIAPSRMLSSQDEVEVSLVNKINEDGTFAAAVPTRITKAQFEKPSSDEEEIKPFSINPYNASATLPNTIWLYVPVAMGDSSKKEWIEYPISWLTTDKGSNELNIIKQNDDGNYVLAHPTTKETKFVVYGVVGAPGRQITVAMSILNMASNIQSYQLFLPSGEEFNLSESVGIDPYLSYESALPSEFVAVLGSGQTVSGETDWYYGDYPIKRSGEYLGKAYDGKYDDDGYYIFSRKGGFYTLKMVVAEGEVSNEIFIDISVDSRDIYEYTVPSGNTIVRVSDYVDIFAESKGVTYQDGQTYVGEPAPGYTSIGYYTEYSSTLLKRINELIANDGKGIAGFAFQQTGLNNLYAKEVQWDVDVLKKIANSLMKKSSVKTYNLGGTINVGTINETTVTILFSINEITATLTEVGLPKSEDMVVKSVYEISNDQNGDSWISLTQNTEGKLLLDSAYYRAEQYNDYFGITTGYDDSDYSNVIYFEIDKTFMLSTSPSGAYSSPYDYFVYLFSNLELKFISDSTIKADAKNAINLGGKSIEYFNSAVLGLNSDLVYTDGTSTVSYAFFILEKLSQGSAIDRTLVIVCADKAEAEYLQRKDEIDAFNEDLTERYPESYELPTSVEVVYQKLDGTGSYTAKYATSSWMPDGTATTTTLGTSERSAIEATYIDVTSTTKCEYRFGFEIPDMQKADDANKRTFYYTVEFRKKNALSVNYDASARNSVYDISGGKIYVENAYSFLYKDLYAEEGKEYKFNTSAIPTLISMMTATGVYQGGSNDVYEIKWTFNENASFGEEIFSRGTVDDHGDNNGVLVATYEFDSYYQKQADGTYEKVKQTLELYLVIEPMNFYAIESDTFTVVQGTTDDGQNAIYNTIEIDPYNDTAGNNGTFTLPTSLNLVFNGNQKYTFSGISYYLIDEVGSPKRTVSSITYNEKGHTLSYDYTSDPTLLKIVMYFQGHSKEMGDLQGVRIYVKFLQRIITSSQIPNAVYEEDGSYAYVTDEKGNVSIVDGEPQKQEYYAYASYDYTNANGIMTVNGGSMPIYYVDPYNSASFALPTKAKFEFYDGREETKDVYIEYNITGWQFYDVENRRYVDFVTMENSSTPTSKQRFYQIQDGNAYRGYFNAGKDSYAGEYYPLRGYIRVGGEDQYFEVIMVVLNRSLRTSAVLKDEYTVSYDFIDPIGAMLSDIPAMLGADAFVNYDRYNDDFTVTLPDGAVYAFTVSENNQFSHPDSNGNATNYAVVPELLWESEYDTDGDGIPDTLFNELTTKGFTGTIDGNLYLSDTHLADLLEYYTIKVNYDYEKLAMALLWDTLFTSDGSVSNAYSPATKNAITAENATLFQEVVHATYNILLKGTGTEEDIANGLALSADNKQILGSTILEIVLQDINREAQISGGKTYDPDDESDMVYIAYRIYLNVQEEYKQWAQTPRAQKNSKVEIYEAWEINIAEYRKKDVTDDRNISGNQEFKAEHFSKIYYSDTINNEEKTKLTSALTQLKASLYIKANYAIWNEVYAKVNANERIVMDKYASDNRIIEDEEYGVSIACDLLRADLSSLSDIGVKGEGATADISIPVITYNSMLVEGDSDKVIEFNKFNFSSVDKNFTVRFEISYEAVYAQMLEQAKENATQIYREETKATLVSIIEEWGAKERVDAIAPKELDEYGNYSVIKGMLYSDGTPFGYDMYVSKTEQTKYKSFWNALVEYRYASAIKVITANVASLNGKQYADMAYAFDVEYDEYEAVKRALYVIKAPALAEEILTEIESRYDFNTDEQIRLAVGEVAEYVANKNNVALSVAYEGIGLPASYAYDSSYDVDGVWAVVVSEFVKNAFPAIVENVIKEIESDKDITSNNERANAIREIAEFLITEDVYIGELESIYEEAEDAKRFNIMEQLLGGASGDTNIQTAVSLAGGGTKGYAVLFYTAYPEISRMIYTALESTASLEENKAYQTLKETYANDAEKERVIAYMSLISDDSELKTIASEYYDFIVGYRKGVVSPYQKLLENPTPSGYTATQIEKFVGGTLSEDCLLYYVNASEEFVTAINAIKGDLGMTEEEIVLAVKRRILFEAIYKSASTQNKATLDEMKDEALATTIKTAMDTLFSKSSDSIVKALTNYYDTEAATKNVAYDAFVIYVDRKMAQSDEYPTYVYEYLDRYAYEYSKNLLGDFYKEYLGNYTLGGNTANSNGFVATTFLTWVFDTRGYETPTTSTDDNLSADIANAYLTASLKEKATSYGIALGTYESSALTGYMKDVLLRGIAYYYDYIATDAQKAIVAEVSEMHIGSSVSGSLEETYLRASISGKASGNLGLAIYEDLISRSDLGVSASEDILNGYYTVWVEIIVSSALHAIENYTGIKDLASYTSDLTKALAVVEGISGDMSDSANEFASEIAVGKAIETMKTTLLVSLLQYDVYAQNYQGTYLNDALVYAYDIMYDEKTQRGTYAYRETLDEILEWVVSQTSDFDEIVFEEAQKTALDDKIGIVENAVSQAVKTVFYSELYDEITLLTFDAEEFAKVVYRYLTGMDADNASELLFGSDRNGEGGIVQEIIREYLLHPEGELTEASGEVLQYVLRLTEWWNTDGKPENSTIYGTLSATEQAMLTQIHKQAYYQTNDVVSGKEGASNLTMKARTNIAYASMLTSIYLFLNDVKSTVKTMPNDYFGASSSDEYKAFIMESMLEGDLMLNQAHSLSLAQAQLIAIAVEKASALAYRLTSQGSVSSDDVTLSDFISIITQAIMCSSPQGVYDKDELDGTTVKRSDIYARYLEKAVNYVEYTSVLGADGYERNADLSKINPIMLYVDSVYIEITGYDINGTEYASGEDESALGMLSFAKIIENIGGDVSLLEEELAKVRIVVVDDFVSQDHATDSDRHIIFFDRSEWESTLGLDEFTANAYYNNKNVYIANGFKSDKYTTTDGYAYTNALVALGYSYVFSDFTTVDLFFDTDESNPYDESKRNLLNLDALSPELPSTAYAIGYIGEDIEIELGKVDVTSYSDEFYKLVYKATTPTEDDAYVITLKTASGYVYMKKGGIKVGYLDRNVDKIYLENNNYNETNVRVETDGEFVNLYSIYDTTSSPTAGKNVIYIDPTDENLILADNKSYIMPSTIAVQCGEGSRVTFTEVEWDLSGVKYGLSGTGDAGYPIRVLSYKYVDDDGNTRKIDYDYNNNKVTMSLYGKDTGTITSTHVYTLTDEDMIEWNTVLKVDDQTLQKINALSDSGSYEELGTANASGVVDASATTNVNPFYPEYPTELQLVLAKDNVLISLTQDDWTPDSTKLNAIKRGDASDYTFTATFMYLGCEIKVTFKAMEIAIPTGETFNGGNIYIISGEGSVQSQFEKNYGTAYFNFNEDENGAPNWQKVPVALKNYGDVKISEDDVQIVDGVIGATGVGELEANATFYVRVIDVKNYAVLDGELNDYVILDYFSVPADDNKKASGAASSPSAMSETYVYTDENGEKTYFSADNTLIEYDFINNTVTIPLTYALDDDTDKRISYNQDGDRIRTVTFSMTMKSYERGNVSSLQFDTDDTGKKWTWTDTPKTSANYADAIYWKIGTSLTASDLPVAVDRDTGEEIYLMWDLSDLNVNRANVADANNVTSSDGTIIYGYYMLKNGVWQSVGLTVYITKIDVTSTVIGFTKDNGTTNTSTYLEKTYDAQYYELPFDALSSNMKFLREDGSRENLSAENFVVEYCLITSENENNDDMREWTTDEYPLNAGSYYIRVRLLEEDYNVYISYTDGWLFKLTVKPYEIDMSKLVFAGENTANSTIEQIYGSTNTYLTVSGGLPEFTPARWFATGEKDYLYQEYYKTYGSQERAKAEVYRVIYARVSDGMKEIIDEWYAEGRTKLNGSYSTENELDVAVKAWVYDNKMDPDLKVVEIGVITNYYRDSILLDYSPTDCGDYTVEITLDASNTNYVTGDAKKTLILKIVKDSNVNYAVANANLVYNGSAQNLEITNLHKNGTVPYGVKLTYTYVVDGETLVVIVEGIKNSQGNVVNKVTIDPSSTVTNPTMGIKDAGAYVCSIVISGGDNYIDGAINDVSVGISPANVFLNIDDIQSKYLSDVVDLSEYLRVYDRNSVLQSEGILLGTDKLADLGVFALSTPVGKHYKVGTYYTYIDGIKTSLAQENTYTYISGTEYALNGEIYSMLELKGYDQAGSLYQDTTGNSAIISLFKNYNVFVRTHEYEEGVKSAGIYRIEQEDGSEGVDTNEELINYIASLKDGDSKILYLSPLTDDQGNSMAYDGITLNVQANITLVGYRNNVSGEIETRINGIRVLKGSITIKILTVEGAKAGESAVYIGDSAGYVGIQDSVITTSLSKSDDVVGITTSVNYKERLYIGGVTIKGLSRAIDFFGGELEMENSTIRENFNGVYIRVESNVISIKSSTFSNNMGTALYSVTDKATIRNNVFEYNAVALDLPEDSSIRTNVNNGNVYDSNGDDYLYE